MLNKDKIDERIEVIKGVMEDLATANDDIMEYSKDFPYQWVVNYISCARRELKSELISLKNQLAE